MAGWGVCRYCRARIWWGTNPNGNGRAFPFDDQDETEIHFESCTARMRATDDAGVSHTVSQCSQCGEGVWWETMPSGSKRPMNVDTLGTHATWTCHFDTCAGREEDRRAYEEEHKKQRDKQVAYSVRLWLPDLELEWPCDVSDVTSAFRRLAMKYHPDMGGTSEDFIRIKLAYDRLKELLPAA